MLVLLIYMYLFNDDTVDNFRCVRVSGASPKTHGEYS